MKKLMVALAVAAALLGMASPSHAWYWGYYGPYGYPSWYGYPAPYVYSPPVVIQRQEPQVYIQRPPEQPQYWYYCQEAKGYYPYVQQCPSGWMQVVPQTTPPAAPR